MPRPLRAALTAAPQAEITLAPLLFLEAAERFTETILPRLFFFRSDFFRPPEVLALVPLKTEDLARLPLATVDFFMTIFFIIFMEAIFLAIFIFMDFFMDIFFIILAMVAEGGFCQDK